MKEIEIKIKIELDDSVLDSFSSDDCGKEELEEQAKTHLESYIARECVGYQNTDKFKVSIE